MYTSILKIKEGELIAVLQSELAADTRLIFESLEFPWGKRLATKLLDVIQRLDLPASIGVDFQTLNRENQGGGFSSLVDSLPATNRGKVAPVLLLGSAKELFDEADSHAARYSGTFYLRAKVVSETADPAQAAFDVLERYSIDPARVRLIVDYADIGDAEAYATWFGLAAPLLEAATEFSDVTIAATSFPTSVSPFREGWTVVERPEMIAWLDLLAKAPTRLGYGDYGCRSSAPPPPKRKFSLPVLGQLRYTLRERFLIYRGVLLKKDPTQHYRIGRDLIRKSEFSGARCSWGDAEFVRLAQGLGGNRGRREMIGYETAHHLKVTEGQI